jgi:Flp pilus assembly pilin Flp
MRSLMRFLHEEEAATAVEYAVMLAMILLAVISAIGMVGGEASIMWKDIDADMTAAFRGD